VEFQDTESSAVVDLNDYLEVFSRRRWLIVGMILLGGALALAYSFAQTEQYTAESAVLVRPGTSNVLDGVQRVDQLVNMSTEREVMRSLVVASIAAAQVQAADEQRLIDNGGQPPVLSVEEREERVRELSRNLREDIEVQTVSDSQVIEVSYTDSTPARAQSVANSVADAYLSFRRTEVETASLAAQNAVQSQIAALALELTESNRVLATAREDSSEFGAAEVNVGVVASEIATLRRQAAVLNQLEINAGSVIDPVQDAPTVPTSPNRNLNTIIGLVLGGLIGVGLAFLRHRTDDRLVQRKDALELFGMRVLGTVPRPRGLRIAGPALDGAAGESSRRLSSNVTFLAESNDLKVLLVTSPNLDTVPISIAAQVAVSASRIGKRVLLVSVNLRDSRMHEMFSLSNTMGLVDVLVGEVGPDVAVQVVEQFPRLDILTSGTPVPQPDELLQTESFRYLLNAQRQAYDLIIVEGPPVNNFADSLAVAPYADGVVLVAEDGKTTKSDLRFAVGQIQGIGANIFGSVIVSGTAGRRTTSGTAKKAKTRTGV